MILRQLLLFVYRSKCYIKENYKGRKGIPAEVTATNEVLELSHRARKVHETYIKLKRFKRSNSYMILKNELMGIKKGERWHGFASVRVGEYPVKNAPYIFGEGNSHPDIFDLDNQQHNFLGEQVITKKNVGRGLSKPVQFYPREALGLDDSYPDIVMLQGSTIIIPDPDSIRPINSDGTAFGDAGHPSEILVEYDKRDNDKDIRDNLGKTMQFYDDTSFYPNGKVPTTEAPAFSTRSLSNVGKSIEIPFRATKYGSEYINAIAKEMLDKFNIQSVKLSDDNNVIIAKVSSDKAIIDIESDTPSFATRALGIIDKNEEGIHQFEHLSGTPLPNNIDDIMKDVNSRLGIPAHLLNTEHGNAIINDMDECMIHANEQPCYYLDPVKVSEHFRLRELDIYTEDGKKMVAIEPIPNDVGAYSVRRLGKLTDLKKGR